MLSHSLLHAKLLKRMDNNMSLHGISFPEYTILHQLHSSTANTMRRIDLAESIGISASGITRMLAPMEKIGLVEKESNPRDARESLVRLSTSGHQIYDDASSTLDLISLSLTDSLTEIQLVKMTKYTLKLLQ